MSLPRNEAWFPAKSYGWGWGLPQRRQGWLVLLALLAGLVAVAPLARTHLPYFIACAAAMLGALIVICLWKGEAPRWRWGEDDPPPGSKDGSAEPTQPGPDS